jgi:sphinganine-1-phosphate aldolase
MYRSKELRRYQYYVFPDWSGGLYASPSMAGSRPGAIIAGAWAVINHIGVE